MKAITAEEVMANAIEKVKEYKLSEEQKQEIHSRIKEWKKAHKNKRLNAEPFIVAYTHHERTVYVRKNLKGKHKDFCLCELCQRFIPESKNKNCKIANALYRLDKKYSLVTPVWECPEFKNKKREER